jgi:ribosomal protein S18 acetylase RimI-like enzyme
MEHRSYWLELCSPAELRPAPFAIDGIALARLRGSEWARGRGLWTEVGRGFWSERAGWSRADWERHLDDASTWFGAAARGAADVGFFELVREGEEVKLEGFGLLPAWRARGLGAGLLSAATRQAFALGARRVWLHTATDDHPHALPNYRARGYRVYREEALEHPMPDASETRGPGPPE